MDEINNLINELQSDIKKASKKEAVDVAMKRDLGPLNEFSRSLLHATLSDSTRQAEEARLAKMEKKRKALRERKKYTRKQGTKHPKRLAKLKRLAYEKKWRKFPYACIRHSWGAWRMTEEEFLQKVAPLWSLYDAKDLTWKRNTEYTHHKGNKDDPYGIYCFNIVHRKKGVVYDGQIQKKLDELQIENSITNPQEQ